MTSIVSIPDAGSRLTDNEGRATRAFRLHIEDLTTKLNANLLGQQVQLTIYTVATLPSASIAGGVIFVTDETGGAVPAFSDGTNWRRVTDRAVVA